MTTRRKFLQGAAAMVAASPLRVALAAAPTDKRFVVVILRGGLDGLAAVPPYADRDYRGLRGSLAIAAPGKADGAIDLDGRFGLHPALAPLHSFYSRRELLFIHAVASPYRSRSHFDGQDLLENGTDTPHGTGDGWLNRALALLGTDSDRRLGLSVGMSVPLLLRGKIPVAAWAPTQLPEPGEEFLRRVAALYRRDAVLGPALAEGMKAHNMNEAVLDSEPSMGGRRARNGNDPQAFATAAKSVAKLLAAKAGPRIAVLELGGWDTHSGQGSTSGRLAAPLAQLAEGLTEFAAASGPAWNDTAIIVATEFGRTVAANGTGGTDHGTGGVAFLLGGAVAGGRVAGTWPGLSANALFEGRDLAPTTDLRSVFKGLLGSHLGLPTDALERVVFPNSREAPPLSGLLRA